LIVPSLVTASMSPTTPESVGVTPPGGEPELPLWRTWEGNDRFYCAGRCMTGPSPRNLLGTFLIVSVPSAVFNALVVPDVANATHVAVLAVGIAWPVWCLGNLLATGTTDPGIVRRRGPPPPSPDGRARARYKTETLENGKTVTVKWNDTIRAYQPVRAHHCSANDDCVDKFDHHCPWVGTTIGRRNYRTFLFFVFGTTLLCAYVVCVCAWQIKLKHDARPHTKRRALQAVGDAPAALVIAVFAFLGFWFVAVLSGFHAYLVCTNQTTYENFRDGYSWRENPHNKGIVGNCWEAFCAPSPASRFDFRRPPSRQPPDRDLAEEEAREAAKKAKRRVERAEREAARRRAEAGDEARAKRVGSAGDVEMGRRGDEEAAAGGGAAASGGAGGVMRALAGGAARSLEEIKVEVEESGYEGDRDRTPKARDESA